MTAKTIVLAISKLRIGGAEQFVITLAKALKKLGHQPHIVLLHSTIDLPVPSDIPVHVFDYQAYRKYPRFLRPLVIPKALDKFILAYTGQPDLVLSNLEGCDKYLCHSKLNNVHLIVHNTLSKRYQITPKKLNHLKKIYLAKPCVGVSYGASEDLKQLFNTPSRIVPTIYDPIDYEKIHQLTTAFIPPFQDYLVNVGNFKPAKRHDRLITAYALSGVNNPLVLVGDGDLRVKAEQLAHQLGVAERVHFIGKTDNPYPYLKNAMGKVISSDVEGLNIAMLEAIGLGVPVISTACPSGPPEVLPSKNLVPLVENIEDNQLPTLIQQLVANPQNFKIELKPDFMPEFAGQQYLKLIEP